MLANFSDRLFITWWPCIRKAILFARIVWRTHWQTTLEKSEKKNSSSKTFSRNNDEKKIEKEKQKSVISIIVFYLCLNIRKCSYRNRNWRFLCLVGYILGAPEHISTTLFFNCARTIALKSMSGDRAHVFMIIHNFFSLIVVDAVFTFQNAVHFSLLLLFLFLSGRSIYPKTMKLYTFFGSTFKDKYNMVYKNRVKNKTKTTT